jgi:mono/diheme cytochrome c family protein
MVAVIATFWGGWYLGRTGGSFNTTTHVAFSRGGERDQTMAETAKDQGQTGVANPVERGRQVYTQNCQACHQLDGRGLAGVFPPLLGSEWVTGPEEIVIRILLNGLQGPVEVAGATYNGLMPAWRDPLTDADLAAVITYIRQWAPNAAGPVEPVAVAAQREATASRTEAWSAAELRAAEQGTAAPKGAP